jgi:hypothetical protein
MRTLSCGMALFFHSCGCDFHTAVQQYPLFSGNPIYFARLVAIDAIRCYIYSIDGRGGSPFAISMRSQYFSAKAPRKGRHHRRGTFAVIRKQENITLLSIANKRKGRTP